MPANPYTNPRLILTVSLLISLASARTWGQSYDSLSGRSLNFDGFSSYVDTRVSDHFPYFTVMAWVKSPEAPQFRQGKGPVHYERNFQLNWDHVQPTAQAACVMQDSAGTWHGAKFGDLQANTWYHLAATYDGDTLKAYLNGRLVSADGSAQGPAKQETDGTLKLGRHATLDSPQYHYFNGSVDEVRVYTVALSQRFVAEQMHHAAPAITSARLALYYQANEAGTDSTLDAVSGTSHARFIGPVLRETGSYPFGPGQTEVFSGAPGALRDISPLSLGFAFNPNQGRPGLFMATRINTPLPAPLAPIGLPSDSLYTPSYLILRPLDDANLQVDSLFWILPSAAALGRVSLYRGDMGTLDPLAPQPRLAGLTNGRILKVTRPSFGVLALGAYRLATATRPTTSAQRPILTQTENGQALLTFPAPGTYQATLHTLDGKRLSTRILEGQARHIITMPAAAGLYILHLSSLQGQYAYRLVR